MKRIASTLPIALLILGFSIYLALAATFDFTEDPPIEEWVARYDGPENDMDEAFAVAVDDLGNIYVTGSSRKSDWTKDFTTIKYDPDGSELWVAFYDGPANENDEAKAVDVDELGNVYVTGWSKGIGTGGDYATIKYDPGGIELWVARYESSGSAHAEDLAVDSVGNVYVTGESYGIDTASDYTTIKYDPDGAELWVARYDGPDSLADSANALALDGSDNVYVTGESGGLGIGYDYATIKYDPEGTELWAARYNGPSGGMRNDDFAHAIAVDSFGNAHVTGQSEGIGTFTPDYLTIKYDPDGTELWVVRYDGPADPSGDIAYDIALDGSGNIYVTGSSQGIDQDDDYATIKYDPDGTELWVARYEGPYDGRDCANAIAVDGSDNVYVTGHSEGSIQYLSDYVTIKYAQPLPCLDEDEDGWGDPASTSCLNPEWDCDDTDPDVNPGADEVCDGVDNNCAGGIDEEPAASASCDNGMFCDGEEYCSEGSCWPGEGPCPDDGLFCTGEESCDEELDECVSSGDPCTDESDCTSDICDEDLDECDNPCIATGPEDSCCEDPACTEEPICIVEFTLEMDATYGEGTLTLDFTIGTPEPVTWAAYLILTYPEVQFIPLWGVELPVVDPPIDYPMAFALPQVGWVGIWTALLTEEGAQAADFAWVDTGWPSR